MHSTIGTLFAQHAVFLSGARNELVREDLAVRWTEYADANGFTPWGLSWSDKRAHFADFVTDSPFARTLSEDSRGQLADAFLCDDCHGPELPEWSVDVHGGDTRVCEDCSTNYSCCAQCEELVTDVTYVWADEHVCEYCLDRHYAYCEHCDAYFSDGDDHEPHGDQGAGCCDSPAPVFALATADGNSIANDTATTVTLPAGTIDREGINRITDYLRGQGLYGLANVALEVDPQWQTKRGNWSKRFSREAHVRLGLKVDPAVLSQLGVIAREHSNSVSLDVEITRDLNLPAEDFGHEDSCWWQSYYPSRCALKSNGGFGLRSFVKHPASQWSNGYREVSGRAWVFPLKHSTTVIKGSPAFPGFPADDPATFESCGVDTCRAEGCGVPRTAVPGRDATPDREVSALTPTFNTTTADAYIVFNGYGDLSGYAAARVIASLTGLTYRKVGFRAEPCFINGDTGYLVCSEETAKRHEDQGLVLNLDDHSTLYHDEAAARPAAVNTESEICNA